MNLVILGANGQTGRLLTRRAVDRGLSAVAVTRRPQDFPFAHPNLRVARADVRDAASLEDVIDGADAVVSTLGVPMSRRPIDTYSAGATNVVAAMRRAGAARLVVVSSTAVANYPGRTGAPVALRVVEPILKNTLGKSTYADQRRMEAMVSSSGLDWTVVRPSGLFDLPHVTEYVAGHRDPIGAFTSRADLADYLLHSAVTADGDRGVVTISTVTDTPTLWQMVRREAFAGA
ncbi:NAD(P)H-binding protein [Mycobacterium manitobense]|uniref:NAD(P)H-binding protein n=1 Tax=[Mycobacterium] manitobense TaxID=190147 RepID=A0A9X2YL53_9MYCO|nr:NAD(P)H-binding protein [[Mycobacterium] manitobense]MCV7169764.1 NAD(P)H-binding protein [[Mycobacterium] manitobense]